MDSKNAPAVAADEDTIPMENLGSVGSLLALVTPIVAWGMVLVGIFF